MLPLGRAAGADRAVAAAHYQQLSARSLRSAQERCRGVREASVNTRINRASNSCSTSVGTCYAGKQGGSFIERSFTNSNPTAMTESTEALASSSPLPPSKVDERGQSVSHHRPVRQPERQRWNSCSSVGRSTLLCGGRVVLGGHFLFSLGTLALLVVTLVLFVLSAMRNLGTYWLLSGIVLWTLSIIFLVQTAASDPGVIARDTSDVKPDPPLDFDVGPDGPSHRFCDTCNIWRPPRAKHCRVCDNCVRRFDHHCAWLGTCVAERNYRSFVMFMFTTTILTGFVIVACFAIGVPKFRDYDFGDALAQFPEAIVLFIIGFWTFLALASLSVYHCNLISIGQTTNENVRDVYRHRSNPYNKGCIANFWSVLCGSVSPSALRFSELREESDGTDFDRTRRQLAPSPLRSDVDVSVLSVQDRSEQV